MKREKKASDQSFLVMDLEGIELTNQERDLLQHPCIAGVILFSRNYVSRKQLMQLCADIKAIHPTAWIMADQEGGRIQRFVSEFQALPSLTSIGEMASHHLELALKQASEVAMVMANELQETGLDFSLVPVLDVLHPDNPVLRERAFHADPQMVLNLADAYISGLNTKKMWAVGKHFPGHGSVSLDSHLHLPVDHRSFDAIFSHDLIPFRELIARNRLQAVMSAHILFPNVDPEPATFSSFWLKDVLRTQLKFDGLIFSDDLNMQGAVLRYPDPIERVTRSKEAGCDVMLFCNNRPDLLTVLDHFNLNI